MIPRHTTRVITLGLRKLFLVTETDTRIIHHMRRYRSVHVHVYMYVAGACTRYTYKVRESSIKKKRNVCGSSFSAVYTRFFQPKGPTLKKKIDLSKPNLYVNTFLRPTNSRKAHPTKSSLTPVDNLVPQTPWRFRPRRQALPPRPHQ